LRFKFVPAIQYPSQTKFYFCLPQSAYVYLDDIRLTLHQERAGNFGSVVGSIRVAYQCSKFQVWMPSCFINIKIIPQYTIATNIYTNSLSKHILISVLSINVQN